MFLKLLRYLPYIVSDREVREEYWSPGVVSIAEKHEEPKNQLTSRYCMQLEHSTAVPL